MDNYPDGINDSKGNPRSPAYDGRHDQGESDTRAKIQELMNSDELTNLFMDYNHEFAALYLKHRKEPNTLGRVIDNYIKSRIRQIAIDTD